MGTTESVTDAEQAEATRNVWLSGIVVGIAGGIVFGVLMQMMMPDILEMAIPGMYALSPSFALGWLIHLFHSAVFGLIYAGIVQFDALAEYATRVSTGGGLGIAYGVIVWVIAASIVMPLWVGVMLPVNPPVPDFNPMSLVGHAVYGVILGTLYPEVTARIGSHSPDISATG